MKNILLIIIIILLSIQTFYKVNNKEVYKKTIKKEEGIKIGRTYKETKTVKAESLDKNKVKHSTTLNTYTDTDNRSRVGVTHRIRINKEWYMSGSVNTRSSSYGNQNTSGNLSITRYW